MIIGALSEERYSTPDIDFITPLTNTIHDCIRITVKLKINIIRAIA